MRVAVLFLCVFALLVLASPAAAQSRLTGVEPMSGKAGDTVAANGENLEKDKVAEIFLTDGTNDFKAEIVDQTATAIKFKIPANVKPARYALMIRTAGAEPRLLEQPVKISVE